MTCPSRPATQGLTGSAPGSTPSRQRSSRWRRPDERDDHAERRHRHGDRGQHLLPAALVAHGRLAGAHQVLDGRVVGRQRHQLLRGAPGRARAAMSAVTHRAWCNSHVDAEDGPGFCSRESEPAPSFGADITEEEDGLAVDVWHPMRPGRTAGPSRPPSSEPSPPNWSRPPSSSRSENLPPTWRKVGATFVQVGRRSTLHWWVQVGAQYLSKRPSCDTGHEVPDLRTRRAPVRPGTAADRPGGLPHGGQGTPMTGNV